MRALKTLWKDIQIRRNIVAAAFAVLMLGALLLTVTFVDRSLEEKRRTQVKQNLHTIQLAVERFAVDNLGNVYPWQVEEVIAAGYLEQFPLNPYNDQPMRCIEPGEQPERGDFFYIQRGPSKDEPVTPENITGYTLEAYF